jgi:hypothetical protein
MRNFAQSGHPGEERPVNLVTNPNVRKTAFQSIKKYFRILKMDSRIGVDVMITLFGEKIGIFFSKTNVMIILFQK